MKKIVFLCLIFFQFVVVLECMPQGAHFDLSVVGYVNFADGIGRQSIGIIDCLKDVLKVNYVNTRKNTPINFQDIPDDVQKIIKQRAKGFANVAILEDVLTNGNPDIESREDYFKCMPPAHIKLAYTMFETTTIPDRWAEIINNHFDAAVVPDEFLVKVYQDAGVNKPIFVLPLGVYLENFLQQPLKTAKQNPFIFGFSGAFSERKNHVTLFESFVQAFGNDPSVRLRLHGRTNGPMTQKIQQRIIDLGLTNVDLIIKSFTAQEYLAFMQSLDCFVSFSKGEGFSIAPREALALGMPSILIAHTAHYTLCNTDFVLSILASIAQPAYYPHLEQTVGYEFNCSVADGAEAFKKMYQNYDYFLARNNDARKWAAQYQYAALQKKYVSLIKPQKIVLGTENRIENDFLETSDPALYQKYVTLEPVIEKQIEATNNAAICSCKEPPNFLTK